MTLTNKFKNKLLVVNKHSGPTSFDVVRCFRKATKIRKVGHTGTLDPMATGVLLLCTGKATKAVEHFMDIEKEYEFTVHLGIETTTLDAHGDVVREVECPEIPEDDIRAAAASFVGDYTLIPPAYSAIKQDGRRLYDRARAGEDVKADGRVVRIYSLDVTGIELPFVELRVRCSRGTYVRSIASDLGKCLNLPAHVSRLTRTAIGPYRIADAFPSERIFEGDLEGLVGIELSDALDFLPGVVLKDSSRQQLLDGGLPVEEDVIGTVGKAVDSPYLRILDEAGHLLAIGNRDRGDSIEPGALVGSYRLFVDRGASS